ncbi:MAG: tRNA pseudouridine(38-40) synthase TruA [Desulfobacterales bacterium]|nr:tRNA pseudouridine(38-40) synthase TruA [Desulfobacterales bacterium]
MPKSFKLTIEYDGTDYSGWQRQQDRTTIQGELESVLSLILNQEIKIAGSGRTDAGVHAHAQVASFTAETSMGPEGLIRAVNSLLKKQAIVLRDIHEVEADFHAQYSATSKEYHYWILNSKIPSALESRYVWHVHQPLDMAPMAACCDHILGVHDFKSFENVGSPRTSTIREIFSASIQAKSRDRLRFSVCASGFLKNMVRNLVGSIVAAGRGRISPDEFKAVLEAKDRTLADATAPARGLFLHRVNYGE